MNKSISKQIFLKFELFTVQDLLVAVAEAYLEPSRTSTIEPCTRPFSGCCRSVFRTKSNIYDGAKVLDKKILTLPTTYCVST